MSPSKRLEALRKSFSVECSLRGMIRSSEVVLPTTVMRPVPRSALCDVSLITCFGDSEKHTPGNVKLWESPGRAGGLPKGNQDVFQATVDMINARYGISMTGDEA